MKVPESYKQPKPSIDEKNFWIDPDKDSPPGLLLSDRIWFYCKKANLIWPHAEEYLEPASYTLHAGREYLISIRPGQVEPYDLEKEGRVVVPPNGLIYIRFFEEVNIPYYMIARFNLRVTQVYRGLLLGTGPQVDPGYMGRLGCPIHNFTDEEKTIEFFEQLVTIDFEKTTPLGHNFFNGEKNKTLTSQDYVAMKSGVVKIKGREDYQCKIFNKRVNATFLSFLPPGQSVRSSVHALHEDVNKVKDEIKEQEKRITFYRRVAIGVIVGSLVSAIGLVLGIYINFKDDLAKRYMDLKSDIVELNKSIGRLERMQENERVAPISSNQQKKEDLTGVKENPNRNNPDSQKKH